MKMKIEDYNRLETAILEAKERHSVELIAYHSRGLSSMRYRWDLFNLSLDSWLEHRLYSYLDDNHIDTALRAITKTS